MKFEGEHLLPGQLGHFFVILSFVAALIATLSFLNASRTQDLVLKRNWLRTARTAFLIQTGGVLVVFATIFYICSNHLFEYMYAYKHASKDLEYKYLLACIWEGQEGSFLLWTIWHSVLGIILIKKSKEWEAPVMTVISFAQFFLLMMILGIYFGNIKIGNSPFTLTRNEGVLDQAARLHSDMDISKPLRPDYLKSLVNGIGLNVLLRNYWMVIHPPILFLGFASTIVPFAFAYAGIQTKKFTEWVKPALPWLLMGAAILGTGIMMGGKWAYESLNFGGYWAWDPVENASMVPWLLLIAGLHTMVVYKATGRSLRASFLFAILGFVFVLYATFLTRTGILGETSVHAFTETGDDIAFRLLGHLFVFKAMNALIFLFFLVFTIPSLFLFFKNYNKIPAVHREEGTDSREFWMFVGSLVLFLTAIFITAKTSIPVYNKIFGTNIAPPEDAEFSYNRIVILVAIIIGLLTAVTQFFRYKATPTKIFLQKLLLPTIITVVIFLLLVFFAPFTYYKQGGGFLGAIYAAAFAVIYAAVANAFYLFGMQKGKFMKAGGSVAHAGFAIMLAGMLISSANKTVISRSAGDGLSFGDGKDPMTKENIDPRENLTLIRDIPTMMGDYRVSYFKDSSGKELNRIFYKLDFEKKNAAGKTTEHFHLEPDVYQMKDNNLSSNPDTKSYLFKDVFTYITATLNKSARVDTAQFREVLMNPGDTAFYSQGILVLNEVEKNPAKYSSGADAKVSLMAHITITSKDSMHYRAAPAILIDSFGIENADDTVYAQNLFVRFIGVDANHKLKIGIKESDQLIDYVTVKAYVFPMINLVWLGLVIMAAGLIISMLQRGKFSRNQSLVIFICGVAFIFYMFLIANA